MILLFCAGVFGHFLISNGFFLLVAGVEKVWRALGKVGEVGGLVTGRILILPAISLCVFQHKQL